MNDAFDNAHADRAILAKLTKLPTFAEGDDYPRMLLCIGGANKLHISKGDSWEGTLCGAAGNNVRPVYIVETVYQRRPVCAACRKVAQAGRD